MDFSSLFLQQTERLPSYREIYDIANDLAGDTRVWLIGGAVFRPLAAAIWGGAFDVPDFDLLFERLSKDTSMPAGWVVERNRYGNPKLLRGGTEVDIIPLVGIHASRIGEDPTIENYLSGTPLNVQSIAFDIRVRRIIGEVGVQALLDRTVRVNAAEEYAAVTRKYPGIEYAGVRAKALGFKLEI